MEPKPVKNKKNGFIDSWLFEEDREKELVYTAQKLEGGRTAGSPLK